MKFPGLHLSNVCNTNRKLSVLYYVDKHSHVWELTLVYLRFCSVAGRNINKLVQQDSFEFNTMTTVESNIKIVVEA